jgi:hypothetical protein
LLSEIPEEKRMRTEPRRVSSLGELINRELEQSLRSHPVEVKAHAEPHIDTAISAMTNNLIPQLRADQRLIQRATAQNELTRRTNQAALERARMEAPPVDIDLYE